MQNAIRAVSSVESSEWLGNGIHIGTIHSVFSKAVNIIFENSLFSVLSKKALLESMSLRIDEDIDFVRYGIRAEDQAVLSKDAIILGPLILKIELAVTWNEIKDVVPVAELEDLIKARDILHEFLSMKRAEEGIAIIFGPEPEGNRDKLLKQIYEERTSSLLEAETEEELNNAIRSIVGLGPGLTPSGDDFLSGYIRTRLVFHSEKNFEDSISNYSRFTNEISAKSLLLSVKKQVSDEENKLLFELLDTRGNIEAAKEHMERISNYGSTSGMDLLSGILYGIIKEIQLGCKCCSLLK